jgi:hypothetical protein
MVTWRLVDEISKRKLTSCDGGHYHCIDGIVVVIVREGPREVQVEVRKFPKFFSNSE